MEDQINNKIPTPEKEEDNEVAMAVIAYILFFIPLITDSKDEPFVKFHVKQSLINFCVYMGFSILRYTPLIGTILWRLTPIIALVYIVFVVLGIVNALNKEQKELPLIGKYAEKVFKF
jgi:uncharacterized membrane protein